MTKRHLFNTNIFRGLRFRLIGWYVLLLLVSLIFFSVYIFFQFRDLQQKQQDTLLDVTADKLRGAVDIGNPSGPYLRTFPGAGPGRDIGITQDISQQNIQVHIYNSSGQLLGSLGSAASLMPTANPAVTGVSFVTLNTGSQGQWRIYNSPLPGRNDVPVGWIQVGQPVVLLNAELNGLFIPILLGTVIAMVLAVSGGLFLANQALRPIDRVTRTAQAISTEDLSRRINYDGPQDEVGRLAKTLDQTFDRLERGFEQERRFTSDASHEMRTPLTALKGRIEVTLSRSRNAEEYRETLADLNQGVDRLIGLSNSLLYLARLDQANQQWQSETLDLSDFVDSILDSMQPVAELKNIELRGVFASDVPVRGNLDQLTRLFLNLLGNALKYTQEDGHITFKLEKRDKMAIVTVTDDGPGIAAEHLPHLFERFYRVESDRASATGGTGLGLAIAHEIARQHGGVLEIESEPGRGTIARVGLPLAEASFK